MWIERMMNHVGRARSARILAVLGGLAICLAGSAGHAQDFNGDGIPDLAIGTRGEDLPGAAADAGAVHIIYGLGPGLGLDAFAPLPSALITQAGIEVVEAGDLFGAALAWGDFNGDGFDDLAIGSPGEDWMGMVDAGMVVVLGGSPAGPMVMFPPIFVQGGALADVAEPADAVGFSLVAGDFNGDGFDDLAIGAPGEDTAAVDAGLVNILHGFGGGLLPPPGPPAFGQDGVIFAGDPPEAGDGFGFSLASRDFNGDGADDLAIGAPMEDFGAVVDSGTVDVLYGVVGLGLDPFAGLPSESWTQASPGVPSAPAAGDLFGRAVAAGNFDGALGDDLAIGTPGETVGGFAGAGNVSVIYSAGLALGLEGVGGPLPAEAWSQNTAGVPGAAAAGDAFGFSLAARNFDAVIGPDLAIGVPGDTVGGFGGAGAVNVIYSEGGGVGLGVGVTGPELWHQNSAGVPEIAAGGDNLGVSLATGDFDFNGAFDLAMGAPGEDVGGGPVVDAGCVNTLYGTPGAGFGLGAGGPVAAELWTQSTAGVPDVAELGDGFGGALHQR